MGLDVGLEESVCLSLCGLVGRISSRTLCKCSLSNWISSAWFHLMGYVLEIIFLSHGWFGLLFNSPKDAKPILDSLWAINGCSLILKRWRVSFDLAMDYFRLHHLWVLLPSLPLHYWTEKSLAAIGNELRRFIYLDDNILKGSHRKWPGYWFSWMYMRGNPRHWILFGEVVR
jgi:hypothetical protein